MTKLVTEQYIEMYGRLSGLDGSALDCPFGHDAALLRTAWHAGFTRGRLQVRTLPPPRARSRKDP